jgi:hypothetical protein
VAGRRALAASVVAVRLPAYLVLLRVGFTKPLVLPPARWALTPPFHPYLAPSLAVRRLAVCFLLHWPSTRLEARIPDVIRHTALRSSDFPPLLDTRGASSSDRPAVCTAFSVTVRVSGIAGVDRCAMHGWPKVRLAA